MSILVIGSFMMDLVVRAPRAPKNGETIIGENFSRFPGGKGANQAVSAARLGGKVMMVGKFGKDEFGNEAIKTLKNERVDTTYILRDEKYATGVGLVTIDGNGDNRIIVVPGANLAYETEELKDVRELILNTKILVVQLEMNISMIEQAVTYAYESQVPIILNPAPAQKLSNKLLEKVTYLTPNETEAEILTGIKITSIEDAEKAGKVLLDRGVKNIIITLGKNGSMIINNDGSCYIPGYPVEPHDTVAAGDAFNGALAVGIVNGQSLTEVIQRANAAGALTVTKEGSIPSLPSKKELECFLKKQKANLNY